MWLRDDNSSREPRSLHIEDKTLEVFALGMVDVDGMVGGLGELVEDAHTAAGLGAGSEFGQAELYLGYCMRA